MTKVTGGGVPAGTQLNGIYEIDERVAMGGMGEVYVGHNIQTGDKVAIKMILPELAHDPVILDLFRREATTLSRLHHEAIVRYHVFTVDPAMERPYMAMEFVGGPSLVDRLRDGPLDRIELEVLRRRLASGLAAAHKLGVFHRDISPDNVILVDGKVENAKIIDFGIAKSSGAGGTLIGSGFAGKLNYISPEQLGLPGGEVTGQSDVYSLGLVLAQAATGRALPMGGTQAEVLERRRSVPDLTAVPPWIRPLIARMLDPDPARRPNGMTEVEAWTVKAGSGAARGSRLPRVLAWAAVAVTAAVAGYVALMPGEETSSPRDEVPPLVLVWPGDTAPPPKGDTTPPKDTNPPPGADLAPVIGNRIALPVHADNGDEVNLRLATVTDEAGPEGVALRIDGRLPNGLQLISAAGGVAQLYGRPAENGRFAFKLVATDPQGLSATFSIRLEITPPSAFRTLRDYITGYDGGGCFLLRPLDLGARNAHIEAFVAQVDPLYRFDADFKRDQGFEATIEGRLIGDAQCGLIHELSQAAPNALDNRLRIRILKDQLRPGETLEGSVDGGAGVRLFLYDSQGRATDMAQFATPSPTGASFRVPLTGTGPQVLVAALPEPGAGLGAGAALNSLTAARGGGAALALGYVMVAP